MQQNTVLRAEPTLLTKARPIHLQGEYERLPGEPHSKPSSIDSKRIESVRIMPGLEAPLEWLPQSQAAQRGA
jgi:hypothetical protein